MCVIRKYRSRYLAVYAFSFAFYSFNIYIAHRSCIGGEPWPVLPSGVCHSCPWDCWWQTQRLRQLGCIPGQSKHNAWKNLKVSWNGGTPKSSILINGMFHYKPSILGYSGTTIYGNHPYEWMVAAFSTFTCHCLQAAAPRQWQEAQEAEAGWQNMVHHGSAVMRVAQNHPFLGVPQWWF